MAKRDLRQFDFEKVAKLDKDMWRAYYNHQFLKLFILAVRFIRTQQCLNWYLTIKLVYHSSAAAADYRIRKGYENYERPLRHLIKFFQIISDHSQQPFDFHKAAELELKWWNVDRYPDRFETTREQSLAEAMAVVYKVKAENLSDYGRHRAAAMKIPNHEGDKQAVKPDWQKVESLLIKSWQSLHEAVQ